MQIFDKNKFVTGAEYRDGKGNPREGSIIIPDDTEDAVKIMDGHAFDFDGKKVTVLEEMRPGVKTEEEEKAEEEARRLEEEEKARQFERNREIAKELYVKIKKGTATNKELAEALRLTMWFTNVLIKKSDEEDLPDDPLLEVTVEVTP